MKKNILLYLILILLLTTCSNDNGRRKIKLASNNAGRNLTQSLNSTIRLEESDRQAIVVLPFKNKTGDQNLQWMQKGLTEMFIRALSQSNTLSVMSIDRLSELEERISENRAGDLTDSELTKQIGQEADVDAVLFGSIEKAEANLTLNIKLQDPTSGYVLKEETTTGDNIEDIFDMVDALTQRVKSDLQITLSKGGDQRGITDITTRSLDAWRFYTEGVEALQMLLTEVARQKYLKAIELDSTFVSAYIDLIEVSHMLRDRKQADYCYDKLQHLKKDASAIEVYQIELLEAGRKGDVTQYIETLNRWIENYPGNLQVHWNLAGLYLTWNYPEKSLEHLSHVITIDPKYKLAYNLMAYVYAELGNFEKALTALQVYRDLSKDEANPYDSMGEINFRYGNYDEAEKYYKLALAVNDTFSPSIDHLSELYLEKGESDKAIEYANRSMSFLKDDTSRTVKRKHLASIYLQQNKHDMAMKELEEISKVNPYDLEVVDALYQHYLTLGDTSKARNIVTRTYDITRDRTLSKSFSQKSVAQLGNISVFYGIKVDETIPIIENALRRASNNEPNFQIDEVSTINLKFFLTLLYGKQNDFVKIERLWPDFEIFKEEIWEVFRNSRTQNFSSDWRNYHRLNDIFILSPDTGEDFYTPLIERARSAEIKNIEMMFRLLYVNLKSRTHTNDEIDQQLVYIGTPPESLWMVAGPYPNEDGFRKRFPPEKSFSFPGKNINWRPAKDEQLDGFVDFASINNRDVWSVAYAMIDVVSPDDREAQFRFSSDDGSKIWLNGDNVWTLNMHTPAYFDIRKVTVKLKKGNNRILVKVCNTVGDWGFFLRVTDENGDGMQDIRFQRVDQRRIS